MRVDAPLPRRARLWSESCRAVESRLEAIESALRDAGLVSRRGSAFDRWELHVRGGLLGGARMRMATEEHGEGKQLVRLYSWPVPCPAAFVAAAAGTALAVAAGLDGNAFAAALLGIGTALVLVRAAGDCGVAAAALRGAVERGLVEDGHVQL